MKPNDENLSCLSNMSVNEKKVFTTSGTKDPQRHNEKSTPLKIATRSRGVGRGVPTSNPPSPADVAAAIAAVRARGKPTGYTLKSSIPLTSTTNSSRTPSVPVGKGYSSILEQNPKVKALLAAKRQAQTTTSQSTPTVNASSPSRSTVTPTKETAKEQSPDREKDYQPKQSATAYQSPGQQFFKFAFASRAVSSHPSSPHSNRFDAPKSKPDTQGEENTNPSVDCDNGKKSDSVVERLFPPSSTFSLLGLGNEQNPSNVPMAPSMDEGVENSEINKNIFGLNLNKEKPSTISMNVAPSDEFSNASSNKTDNSKARAILNVESEDTDMLDDDTLPDNVADGEKMDPIYLENISSVFHKNNDPGKVLQKQNSLVSESVDDSTLDDNSISPEAREGIGAYIDALQRGTAKKASDHFVVDDFQYLSSDDDSSEENVSISPETEEQLLAFIDSMKNKPQDQTRENQDGPKRDTQNYDPWHVFAKKAPPKIITATTEEKTKIDDIVADNSYVKENESDDLEDDIEDDIMMTRSSSFVVTSPSSDNVAAAQLQSQAGGLCSMQFNNKLTELKIDESTATILPCETPKNVLSPSQDVCMHPDTEAADKVDLEPVILHVDQTEAPKDVVEEDAMSHESFDPIEMFRTDSGDSVAYQNLDELHPDEGHAKQSVTPSALSFAGPIGTIDQSFLKDISPEGSSQESLMKLNLFIKKANELLDGKENFKATDMKLLLDDARSQGLPLNTIEKLFFSAPLSNTHKNLEVKKKSLKELAEEYVNKANNMVASFLSGQGEFPKDEARQLMREAVSDGISPTEIALIFDDAVDKGISQSKETLPVQSTEIISEVKDDLDMDVDTASVEATSSKEDMKGLKESKDEIENSADPAPIASFEDKIGDKISIDEDEAIDAFLNRSQKDNDISSAPPVAEKDVTDNKPLVDNDDNIFLHIFESDTVIEEDEGRKSLSQDNSDLEINAAPVSAVAQCLSEDSVDKFDHNLIEKFGSMEKVDDDEEISAFLVRMKELKKGENKSLDPSDNEFSEEMNPWKVSEDDKGKSADPATVASPKHEMNDTLIDEDEAIDTFLNRSQKDNDISSASPDAEKDVSDNKPLVDDDNIFLHIFESDTVIEEDEPTAKTFPEQRSKSDSGKESEEMNDFATLALKMDEYGEKAQAIVDKAVVDEREMQQLLDDARKEEIPTDGIESIFNAYKKLQEFEQSEAAAAPAPAPVSAVAQCLSEDSLDKFDHNLIEKFGSMEEVDDNEEISAFLVRMAELKKGGHFKDAKMDEADAEKNYVETDEVEIDLVHGFVNKSLIQTNIELSEEEKLWSDRSKESNPFLVYSDVLKNLPVEKVTRSRYDTHYSSDDSVDPSVHGKVAEYRDVENGNAEVYLIEGANVEVAFVNEKDQVLKTNETSCTQEDKESREVKSKTKSLDKETNSTQDTKKTQQSTIKASATYFSPDRASQGLAAIEKYFEEKEKSRVRYYERKKNYMKDWVSPWEKRDSQTHYSLEREGSSITSVSQRSGSTRTPIGMTINGVAAVCAMQGSRTRFRPKRLPIKQHWRLPYEERVQAHPGFQDVDFDALDEATIVYSEFDRFDDIPWEYREVNQGTIYEYGIEKSNWFGQMKEDRMNKKTHERVCHPKSMSMSSVENAPDALAWKREWYMTWKSRKENPNQLLQDEKVDDSQSAVASHNGTFSVVHEADAIDASPQIGNICTMRLKIGQRITRIHPDYTSSLRRSRFRKKYCKKSSFDG